MLDRMVENACEQDVCSREESPLRRRVLAAFLSQVGLSYRKREGVDQSYEAIRRRLHRLNGLFEPEPVVTRGCRRREENGEMVYVWAAIDCDALG